MMSFANYSEICYSLDCTFLFCCKQDKNIVAVLDNDFISDYNDYICLG